MPRITEELLNRHLRSHCERAVEDRNAISVLESFLRSDGKINTNFACNDKWPNTDGTFEFVSNPTVSRRPEQNFIVQIKGTCNNYTEKDGVVKYSLQSLAFPVYLLKEVSADPGILFVVLHPSERGEERVFWKYMSVEVLYSIDYNQDSYTISFTKDEEIKNTNESVNEFCKQLEDITKLHSFVKKLEDREYSESDIIKIVKRCSDEITESIERLDIYNDTRDNVSRRILSRLEDLCVASLLLNAIKTGEKSVGLPLAFELSLFDRQTKYLSSFLQMLKYIGHRIPDDGQSERLMLKYYDFMWQIRDDFGRSGIDILPNLENFPIEINQIDKSYYEIVARAIEEHQPNGSNLRKSRYYIEKQSAFYVNGKRYYEVTLQLAGIFATKFNRITVYSKEFIPSSYSIQIGYDELNIELWDVTTKIKFITNWKVSIEPACLNKLAKILGFSTKISSSYGEYESLMAYLTNTGINLLDFIDCKEIDFNEQISHIYSKSKTRTYESVLYKLRNDFSVNCCNDGRHTIRYILIRMREEIIESAMPESGGKLLHASKVYLNSKCYPYEKRPLISNFAGSKTSKYTIAKDVIRAVGYDQLSVMRPYLTIKKLIGESGEIYFEDNIIDDVATSIRTFNQNLDAWEMENGYSIKYEDSLVYIESFEKDTLSILRDLKKLSEIGNRGQDAINKKYVKDHKEQLADELKKEALLNVFVSSKVMLIYGAAGTGKTTLINHISNIMVGKSKLFLTKTHAALQNLQRTIENSNNADFISIDSFTKKVRLDEYNVIFVDECSTIDNRTMAKFFEKINSDMFVVLAGDTYQLEAIEFGNWFSYAKELMPDHAKVELLNTWRTDQPELISFWDEVRKRGILIREKLATDGPFSEEIGKPILQNFADDEVVLCLNYDGKFGLNNINALFQANNCNEAYTWQEWTYKVGDPVLFTESKRFPQVFYNNLKGKIVKIEKEENHITFTVDINRLISENDCRNEVEYIDTFDESTRVKFTVYEDEGGTTDDERAESRMKSVVPFHLAYAVSIHKAQGLEYNSVKIIIPDSNAERITHGIFYTAITRAKQNLKIFWSPETMDIVLKSFNGTENQCRSLNLIKNKL